MLALFLGILKIAEDAGIVFALVKLVRPILRPLFPDVPADHPALGMIALNLTATRLRPGQRRDAVRHQGDGGASEAEPVEDTATNSMVMLLAINTAALQLVPPVLLLALMGTQINTLIFPILTTTGSRPHRRHRGGEAARTPPGLPRLRPQPQRAVRRGGA